MINREESSVQAVSRSLSILEELAKEQKGCGVTQLATATGLHKSTVHRLLSTLMSKGYVSKDTNTDRYCLGMKILYLGSSILDRMDVRLVAKPYIEALSYKVKEVVHLAILDDTEAVYIDKVESPENTIRMYSQIGKRAALHCTGVGKIFLAWMPESQSEAILKSKEMRAYTPNTITNIEDMKKHLEQIRNNGYAIDNIEHEDGVRCVAAPIFDMHHNVIAAISISGPIFKVTEDRVQALVDDILNTAGEISYHMGYLKK
ncbi:MAG: IclR family transcriptional regulator [Caulobacteraceae bacterium]